MALADLHVHSKYSSHPSEWFLQRIGTAESYTEPEFIYKKAKERGMDYVAITDHNCIEGALKLKKKYPKEVIVGVEATAYFPEDGCKVHILLFDIDEKQFSKIQEYRKDIYKLREYIKNNEIAYSVAHATYSINADIKTEHLEKLILLFDVFEVINGGRNNRNNESWYKFLINLEKKDIKKMQDRHKIKPMSDEAWVKGFTAGSDDHAGLFIGETYTGTKADSLSEFVNRIKSKKTKAFGRHSDFKSLAFVIYKIAYEFAKTKSDGLSSTLLSQINKHIFEDKKLTFKEHLMLKKMKKDKGDDTPSVKKLVAELVEQLKKEPDIDMTERLNIVYGKVSEISDTMVKKFSENMQEKLKEGDIFSIINSVSSAIPGVFMYVPFISTFKHMFNNRNIVNDLHKSIGKVDVRSEKRILWFSDTLNDLNGVSVTLKKIGWIAHNTGRDLKLVTSLAEDEMGEEMPPNMINLPFLTYFSLHFYEKYKIKIPSILKSMEMIYKYDPDEIYISTPGPIGLMGLMMAKLFNLKCRGVYHTDFTMQIKEISEDKSVESVVEAYVKWFYDKVDDIAAPTKEYIDILTERGMSKKKMSVFERGIETEIFFPKETAREEVRIKYGVGEGFTIIYAGRVSKDKNLEFMSKVYNELRDEKIDINFIVAGDGPYLQEYKELFKNDKRVIFTNAVKYAEMPDLYSISDLMVFPSITDTFGMAVLEAQACGIPVIVSDTGGPKEIIEDGVTGSVLKTNNALLWVEKIKEYIEMKNTGEEFKKMKLSSRKRVEQKYNWDVVMEKMFR